MAGNVSGFFILKGRKGGEKMIKILPFGCEKD
jgi:hypothetical protein